MNNDKKGTEKTADNYYLKPIKFVRDLVLGYVYLTKFDLEIIDTIEFQRLKDIRQLTCQQVFPAARHTRFEHSLGVMELMRQAIKNLNRNGFISEAPMGIENIENCKVIFNKHLQFNAALAALLHDIGHCPFSHLGEEEMERTAVWNELYKTVNEFDRLKDSELQNEFNRAKKENIPPEKFGAKHEQLSCIVIIRKISSNILQNIDDNSKFEDGSQLQVDYELIIRCILGLKYDVSTDEKFNKYKEKNVIINLLNSRIFDLDKLDYVMRDSLFTGIGAPKIDTHRLFRNMYLNNAMDYNIVFTNRAVPSLQNMIESRDELYMYVYNHHTSVFSDFMFSYIFRRLAHNEHYFRTLKYCVESGEEISAYCSNELNLLGLVSKEYLFSPEAIFVYNRSDSDFVSLLNNIDSYYTSDKKTEIVRGLLRTSDNSSEKSINDLCDNIKRAHKLVSNYQKRQYLKPWWKTSSEFNNFIKANFRDDRVREQLCNWICKGEGELKSDEFRSQLAKNVSYITKEIKTKNFGLIKELEKDEFFVIQRSSHFFDSKTIGELDIALKSNEILGSPGDVKSCSGNFYIKSLTNVIPQRDYYSMYAENSFYIFSKSLEIVDHNEPLTHDKRSRHYQLIEQIFVFVATTIIKDGIRTFKLNYNASNPKAEVEAHKKMYERFIQQYHTGDEKSTE